MYRTEKYKKLKAEVEKQSKKCKITFDRYQNASFITAYHYIAKWATRRPHRHKFTKQRPNNVNKGSSHFVYQFFIDFKEKISWTPPTRESVKQATKNLYTSKHNIFGVSWLFISGNGKINGQGWKLQNNSAFPRTSV